jgi:hypothetical protein
MAVITIFNNELRSAHHVCRSQAVSMAASHTFAADPQADSVLVWSGSGVSVRSASSISSIRRAVAPLARSRQAAGGSSGKQRGREQLYLARARGRRMTDWAGAWPFAGSVLNLQPKQNRPLASFASQGMAEAMIKPEYRIPNRWRRSL